MNLTHKLLVASSKIRDSIFSKSVVFLFKHGSGGAEGVILNSREIGQVGFGQMSDLFDGDGPPNFEQVKRAIKSGKLDSVPLYAGGPVRTPGIYFVHGYEQYSNPHEQYEKPEFDLGIPTSFNLFDSDGNCESGPEKDMFGQNANWNIMDGLYFGSPVSFAMLVEHDLISEKKFRFFTGQSSWAPGQLENEIASGAWTVMDCTADMFFDLPALNKLVGKTSMGGYNMGKNQPEKPKSPYKPGGVHDWLSKFNPSDN